MRLAVADHPPHSLAMLNSHGLTASLRNTEVWIFDLDNTLYPSSCNLFAQVSRKMGEFIARQFDLSPDNARAMQKQFFLKHGTTLRGLMVEHGIEPEPFLAYVHDIDVSGIERSPQLAAALDRLPGRKLIYTNGSVAHANNITSRIGISHCFDGVFGITQATYLPKPDPRPYAALVRQFGISPASACMVEDMARNLVPAKELGMTTVLVDADEEWAGTADAGILASIDHRVSDLAAWLEQIA